MRTFHLGERARALDEACETYLAELEKPLRNNGQLYRVKLTLLAKALSYARARRNMAAKQPSTPTVAVCPGCHKPIALSGLGRPRKYHDARCYNLARRLAR